MRGHSGAAERDPGWQVLDHALINLFSSYLDEVIMSGRSGEWATAVG